MSAIKVVFGTNVFIEEVNGYGYKGMITLTINQFLTLSRYLRGSIPEEGQARVIVIEENGTIRD